MNRREYLAHSGAVTGALATAGCAGLFGGDGGDETDSGDGSDGTGGTADPVANARETLEVLLDQYEASAELLGSIDDDGRVEIEINTLASNVSDIQSTADSLGDEFADEANALTAVGEYLDPIVDGLESIRSGTGSLIAAVNDLGDSDPGAKEETYANALPIFDDADGAFATGVEAFRDTETTVEELPAAGNAVTGSDVSRLQQTHEDIQSQTVALNSLAGALREYASGAARHAEGNTFLREAREALGEEDRERAVDRMRSAQVAMSDATETLDEANSLLEATDPSMAPALESKIDLLTCRSGALRDASEHFVDATEAFLEAANSENREEVERLQQEHVEAVDEGARDVVRCENQ